MWENNFKNNSPDVDIIKTCGLPCDLCVTSNAMTRPRVNPWTVQTIGRNKTEVESVQLGNAYIADIDKCPQDK